MDVVCPRQCLLRAAECADTKHFRKTRSQIVITIMGDLEKKTWEGDRKEQTRVFLICQQSTNHLTIIQHLKCEFLGKNMSHH